MTLQSKQVNSAMSKNCPAGEKKSKSSGGDTSKARDGRGGEKSARPVDINKFQLYFDFTANVNSIKPHQVCLRSLDLCPVWAPGL